MRQGRPDQNAMSLKDLKPNSPTSSGFASLVRRLVYRMNWHGPFWVVRRAVAEVRRPMTFPGMLVNGAIRKALRCWQDIWGTERMSSHPGDLLLAIYDLRVEPNTFDVMWFLLAAERSRRERGLRALHIIFIGMARDEPEDYVQTFRGLSAHDRILNILVPHAWATTSVENIEVVNNVAELRDRLTCCPSANLFPAAYSVDWHRSCIVDCYRTVLRQANVKGTFRATKAALSYIDEWLSGHGATGNAVSITIRSYRYNPDRNSNMEEWLKTAAVLARSRLYSRVHTRY